MKKSVKTLSLLLAVVMILCLAGCGSAKNASQAAYATNSAADYYYGAEVPMAEPAAAAEWSEAESNAKVQGTGGLSAADSSARTDYDMSEKIIYNAEVRLETTEFDQALEQIAQLVKDLGGYMESTSISGNNYSSIARGSAGTRNAYYTIRVPSARFSELTGTLSEIGNVPYSRTYTRNITTQYYDTQSRLEAYKVQETRLLEMLSIAETVDDMLAIQRELTDVQYEIDSLTGTLRYYDNQVGYSTVDLTVQEVRVYTPEPSVKLTYWQRMGKEFRESVENTIDFFKEFFLWLVTSLPWMIPLALVIWLAVRLIRRRIARNPERAARRAARRQARLDLRAARRAARKAKKGGEPPADQNG